MRKNRTAAISATVERNPNAFRPKIAPVKANASNPLSLQGTPIRGQQAPSARHSKG